MNVLEQAENFAEGKADQAITKAIADAYIEGYKAGYKNREEEIPMDLRDEKTEYVDLGLPSRTLWSTDYEHKQGEGGYLFLPYEKAENFKLPTKEQWEELFTLCEWEHIFKQGDYLSHLEDFEQIYYGVNCVGPNGQILSFKTTGRITTDSVRDLKDVFFWQKDNRDSRSKCAVHIFQEYNLISRYAKIEVSNAFVGFKLPIRLVR